MEKNMENHGNSWKNIVKIMVKIMENHGKTWKNIVKTGRFSGNFPEIHRIINQSFFLNRSNGGSFHLSTPF